MRRTPSAGRELWLRDAMDGALDAYDDVLVTARPSWARITLSALGAADHVLVVTEPRTASVDVVALDAIAADITTTRS